MNDLQFLIGRAPHVCYAQIADDEIVILNPADEHFYLLNETAVNLWLAMEAPKTVLELSQMLSQKYLESPDTCQQDVVEWVEDTLQKGLLRWMPG